MRHFWWFSNTVTKLLRLSSLPTTNARQTQASLVCHDLEKITCVERFELGLLETRESFDQLEKLEWMVRSRKRGKFSRSTPSSSVAWGSKKTRNLLNTGAAALSLLRSLAFHGETTLLKKFYRASQGGKEEYWDSKLQSNTIETSCKILVKTSEASFSKLKIFLLQRTDCSAILSNAQFSVVISNAQKFSAVLSSSQQGSAVLSNAQQVSAVLRSSQQCSAVFRSSQ